MASLRSVVFDHSEASPRRLSDGQVLEELAWRLSKGVVHVHQVPSPRTAWRTSQTESAPAEMAFIPKSTAPQPGSEAPPPRQIEEADTFSSQTDAAATAAVLRSAAASGTPFCEECAKAAAARKAA